MEYLIRVCFCIIYLLVHVLFNNAVPTTCINYRGYYLLIIRDSAGTFLTNATGA